MVVTLFTFGVSWAVYALVFFGMTRVMPQFHSDYTQSTFTVAFLIGFLDAAFLKGLRLIGFKVPIALLLCLSIGLNYILIAGTTGMAPTYYVTGHKGTVIVALVLGMVMAILEWLKEKFLSAVDL